MTGGTRNLHFSRFDDPLIHFLRLHIRIIQVSGVVSLGLLVKRPMGRRGT